MSRLVKNLVKNPKVLVEIQSLELSKKEKEKLTELASLLYHQKLLNRVLDYLEEEDKKIFLEMLVSENDDKYLLFLHERIENLENIVEVAVLEIEEQISKDLKEFIEN